MSTRRGGKPPLGIKDTLAIAALQQKAAAAVTEAAEDCVVLLRQRDLSQGWKPEEEELTDDFQVLADLVNELLEQGEPGLSVESLAKASWDAGQRVKSTRIALESLYL